MAFGKERQMSGPSASSIPGNTEELINQKKRVSVLNKRTVIMAFLTIKNDPVHGKGMQRK